MKFGDIIVRCYNNGRKSICIYTGHIVGEEPIITYLGGSFYDDGGLSRLDSYGAGFNSDDWFYRDATINEVVFILNDLKEYKKEHGNLGFYHHNTFKNYFRDLEHIIELVGKYKNYLRKAKLEKINNIKLVH